MSFFYKFSENCHGSERIKLSYNIQSLKSFIGCTEGTYGNGKRAVKVACYRAAVAVSVPLYMETAF